MASGSEHVQQNLIRLQLYEVTRTRRKELRRGSYAAVFEVMVQGTPCAAKEVHPILMSAKSKESFYAECVHSSQLLHPNIVQFMGIHYPSPNAELPWLVMELMYISLTGLIEQQEKKRKDIPFHFKMSILVGACQGLQFLHSKKIAHRDLSSNNILLTKHLVAKIADLGMAKVILGDSQKHTLAPGTQIFMPPEALAQGEVVYGIAIDVFSVGCVCLHVISMQWPTPKAMKLLDSKTGKVVALTELQRRETYLPKFQQFPTLRELVCKCLHDFPKERPSVTEVLEGLRTVHWDLACHEKDDIIQLYNSVASYTERDKELALKSEQLEYKERELSQKSKQLDALQMKMAEQLQQQQTQLTLTCEQLGEAKEQLTVKDAQLAESRQQIEELHSQLLVAAKENDSQDLHANGGRGPTTRALGRFRRIFVGSHSNIAGASTNAPQANETAEEPEGDPSDDKDEEEIIDDQPWYYGDIPREDTHQMIEMDGDYLVRYSGNKGCYMATLKWEGIIKHFAIQKSDEGYRFEGAFYPSVGKLLNHYRSNKIPVTNHSQAVLIKPINKIVMATDEYTMKHDDIVLDSKPLGKGRFGHIYSGTIRDSHQRVAVKTCYSERIAAAQQFLAEAEVMKQYDHPNIIRLLGVCTDKEPFYIVMELMLGGNFLHFLCNHGANQTIYQLTKYALDAALGMEYLASKNCIHRDLAARNCLIGENNEILKITDFGMSTEADDDYIYSWSSDCEPLPVKWTAPEALNLGQYTSASDVWSYGILLFEIYSCGLSPYPGLSNAQARELVKQGHRMEAPDGTPQDVYNKLMLESWHYEPDDRPTFPEIVQILNAILPKLPKKKLLIF